jgi:hypothetical protein
MATKVDPEIESVSRLLWETLRKDDAAFSNTKNICQSCSKEDQEKFLLGLVYRHPEEDEPVLHTLVRIGKLDVLGETLKKEALSRPEALLATDITLNTTLHKLASNPSGYHYPTLPDVPIGALKKEDLILQNLAGQTPIELALTNLQHKGKSLPQAYEELFADALVSELPDPETLGQTPTTPLEQYLETNDFFQTFPLTGLLTKRIQQNPRLNERNLHNPIPPKGNPPPKKERKEPDGPSFP